MIRQIAKSIREYRRPAILTPFLMVGEVAMEVLIPMLMALIIDEGVYKGDMDYIVKMSILIVLSAFLSLMFGVLGAFTAARASSGFAKNLRHDIFYHLQDFSFRNIDSFSTSSLITRMTTDVQNVQMAFQMMTRICFRAPVMFVFAIVMVANTGGSLVAIFAVAIPVIGVLVYMLMRRVHPIFNRVFHNYDNLNKVVEENLTGIRTVKAYVREDHQIAKFDEASGSIRNDFVKAQRLMALMNPMVQSVAYACMLAICWFGAHLVMGGEMGTGQLMSTFTYTMQILSSLIMVAMIITMMSISRASAERISEVLSTKADMELDGPGLREVPDGAIEFDHVDFSYGGKGQTLCLKDIDLKIEAGQMIGILGTTGSGKSSLVSLIARLYDVTEGSVKVGGHDVREYNLRALRNRVAVVLQKNTLFSGTVRSNLQWGDKDATDEEMSRALKIANADFIYNSPDGLDRVVEQGGNNFSGGQKQRLCIARALLKDPKVIIFDDSTSAVDTATDSQIRQALRNDVKGATKIIISQRVNSVIDADRIIIMANGSVQDIGTHEELLGRNEVYQSLVRVQLGGGSDARSDE